MNQYLKDIEEFHKKFGLEYDGKPRLLTEQLADFREKFMTEELHEWGESCDLNAKHLIAGDDKVTSELEKQLDALVDLVYVALGTAYLQGFAPIFDEAWRRVQEKNMQKVRALREEDSKRSSTFDVVKPEGWTPPSHTDLVAEHAHRAG